MADLCPADIDTDGNLANGRGSDNAVTIDDLVYSLIAFEACAAEVDLESEGAAATGDPQGAVDISDLIFFLVHFEGGCSAVPDAFQALHVHSRR